MLKGVCVGAGYFSHFHFEAWNRQEGVEIVAVCDRDLSKAEKVVGQFGIEKAYSDFSEMIQCEKVDFVDIITPPSTHMELISQAFEAGLHVICQKPIAPTFAEAERIVGLVQETNFRFMVHENWRWQPWYREIKQLIKDEEVISINHRMRMGDGWQHDAYMNRQPYFREMKRLLIHETGIHFIDTFRFLAGEIEGVHSILKRLNPKIAGEDFAWIIFNFESGAVGFYDANRYNESTAKDPRFTFGTMLVETKSGSIRLYEDGRITVQKLGELEIEHFYHFDRVGFAGDCVFHTQQHFCESLRSGDAFETNMLDYMKSLIVEEAVYTSNEKGLPVSIKSES